MVEIVSLADIEAAKGRIGSYLPPSPLYFSPALSELSGREVYCKWESKQKSGAFKERGALNFLLNLSPEQRAQGVCAASMGNHARGLSIFANKLGVPCTIVMPSFASLVKIQACEKAGAKVILEGTVFDEALEYALKYSADEGQRFVHPFNDPLVIAGQGTCGLEILEQLSDVDAVVVSIGGGGLISGIATAIKEKKKDTFILGVQSERSVTHQNQKSAQKPNLSDVTIADGIAVKRIGDITGKIIKERVDALVAVSEGDIANAIVKFLELEKSLVEGAGAAPLAALLAKQLPEKYKKVVLVVSGGNIDINLLSTIIQRDLVERGRRLRVSLSVADRPGLLHQVSGIIATNGANVLDVYHDRSSSIPGIVELGFLLEVRDREHGKSVIKSLEDIGIKVELK